MNGPLVVFALLAILVFAGAVWLLFRARDEEREEDLQMRLRVSGSDESIGGNAMREARNPVVRWVCRLFWRTGAEVQPASVVQGMVVYLVVAIILFVVLNALTAALIVGGVFVVFYLVLAQRASRRRIKTIEQMPSYLENVIRVLSAGNTFEESLVQAARESVDPIRPLFSSIGRQVRLGAPLEAVMAEAGDIYNIRDLKVMALAASINRKYGGSMRSVLKSLIVAIRQRGIAAKELRALTAETRFSAFVLAGITIFLFFYIFLQNRGYYQSMWATTGGKLTLGLTGGMVFVGMFVLWRMIKSIDEAE